MSFIKHIFYVNIVFFLCLQENKYKWLISLFLILGILYILYYINIIHIICIISIFIIISWHRLYPLQNFKNEFVYLLFVLVKGRILKRKNEWYVLNLSNLLYYAVKPSLLWGGRLTHFPIVFFFCVARQYG